MGDRTFFASYPGEMTDDDRASLDRPGFKLFENGYEVPEGVWGSGEGPSDSTTFQVVRLSADDQEDARRQIVEALGREPDHLEIIVEGTAMGA